MLYGCETVILVGDQLNGKLLFSWLSLVMSLMVSLYAVAGDVIDGVFLLLFFHTRCHG